MTSYDNAVAGESTTQEGWTTRRVVTVLALIGSLVGAIATILLGPQSIALVSAEFGTAHGAWFVTAELIGSAVMVPLIARTAELYGKRRIMMIVMAAGIVGSLLVAVAPWYGIALVGRILQGATIASSVLGPAIVREQFPARIAPLAVGLVATGSGLPGALIPFVTGPVIDNLGYRYVFGGLAVAMLALALIIRWTVRESDVRDTGTVDYRGAVLVGVCLGALLAGISLGPTSGWVAPEVIVLIVVAIVAGVLWVRTARNTPKPLIDLSMLRIPGIAAGIAAGGIVAGLGTLFLITSAVVSQTPESGGLGYGFGLSATNYAYLQTFYFLGFLIGGVLAVRALRATSYVNVLLGGLVVLLLAGVLSFVGIHQVLLFGVIHLAVGIVLGTFFSANFNFIFTMVAQERRSSAGSLYLASTMAGQSVLSVVPLTLAAVFIDAAAQGQMTLPVIQFYLYFFVGVALLAVVLVLAARRRTQQDGAASTAREVEIQ